MPQTISPDALITCNRLQTLSRPFLRALCAAALSLIPLAVPVQAESTCSAVSQSGPERIWRAQLAPPPEPELYEGPKPLPGPPDPGPLDPGEVRLHFTGHGSVVIVASDGTIAVTDYNGIPGITTIVPDVVTMNDTVPLQKTDDPDPRIPLVLHGWPDAQGRPAVHDVNVGSMLVRNVTTNTRGTAGQGVRVGGNSIFIFETEGLCIGHFGFLHDMPSDETFAQIGRLDVAIIAIEGRNILPTDQMIAVLRRLQVKVVIPAHWNSYETLAEVMGRFEAEFPVVMTRTPEIDLATTKLPSGLTVILLSPQPFFF